MAAAEALALVEFDEDGISKAFRAEVLDGLAQVPKAIPSRWFYDDEGSRLFEEITRLPEYYPTRAETEILPTGRNREPAEGDVNNKLFILDGDARWQGGSHQARPLGRVRDGIGEREGAKATTDRNPFVGRVVATVGGREVEANGG